MIQKNISKYFPYLISLLVILPLLTSGCFNSQRLPKQDLINTEKISDEKLKNIAKNITVKISDHNENSNTQMGSGTIIGKQGDRYLVITNAHVLFNSDGVPPNSSVLLDSKTFKVMTFDGKNNQATLITNPELAELDLALLEFTTNEDYPFTNIVNYLPKKGEKVLASGFINTNKNLILRDGEITQIPEKSFEKGYQIGYTSSIEKGMSGGAILNSKGEIIGINGRSANPILNTGFIYEDGSKPTPSEIEQYRKLSWGIPAVNFFRQIY